jgi:MoaA/NifB/PqqE/SkfB family radical SAM enzyme
MIVVWRITERCNLACGFCAYDRTVTRSRRDADPAAVRRFGNVLADFQRATDGTVLVSWLGGEPLRWPSLDAIETHFRDECGLRLGVTTNGTTLSQPAVRERLLSRYAELTVSVDAMGAAHDQLRHWPGAFAMLRSAVPALAAAKRTAGAGPKLRANIVLMRETIADFPALCVELGTWGIEEITFNLLGGNDRPEFHAEHRVRAEQFEAFAAALPPLRAGLGRHGIVLRGTDAYLQRLRAGVAGVAQPVDDCGPGERFLFIDEQGRAAPCSFTPDSCGILIDELCTAGDMACLPARFAALRRARQPAPCRNCLSTQVFGKFAA